MCVYLRIILYQNPVATRSKFVPPRGHPRNMYTYMESCTYTCVPLHHPQPTPPRHIGAANSSHLEYTRANSTHSTQRRGGLRPPTRQEWALHKYRKKNKEKEKNEVGFRVSCYAYISLQVWGTVSLFWVQMLCMEFRYIHIFVYMPCVAVCRRVLQRVAVCCSVLQRVAVCCSV